MLIWKIAEDDENEPDTDKNTKCVFSVIFPSFFRRFPSTYVLVFRYPWGKETDFYRSFRPVFCGHTYGCCVGPRPRLIVMATARIIVSLHRREEPLISVDHHAYSRHIRHRPQRS